MPRPHDWGPSTVGHGETQCRRCLITNREAAVLGVMNECQPDTSLEDRILNRKATGVVPEGTVGLHTFRNYAEQQAVLFREYWLRMHADFPDAHPLHMSQEKWWLAYIRWIMLKLID